MFTGKLKMAFTYLTIFNKEMYAKNIKNNFLLSSFIY